ncbi:hypothetical protein MAR_038031 [Mya arenaria]|uniref:EGF-like domain-containing protein n=1 Tax=Mya arenaria TaxID=6604 RepID=A0ABY7FS02_MYAAR|nr:uncharacterized protein LOC128214083 [Mya arenaria]XP_052776296.1 uncharacterized protein LOC128214083 [Mya arenaria]XP_052776297.1 uncharacterized protein LOC128214083 [Mya arenaria]WAR24362.1 hypothetical protein MAR_038031 [Mya arenaria]
MDSPQDESRTEMLAVGIGDDESSQQNDSSHGQSNSRSTCRRWFFTILIATITLAVAFGIGYFSKPLISTEESHPNISKEHGVQFLRQRNSPDLLVNPKQPCNDTHYCEKCTATVISSKHRHEHEGQGQVCRKNPLIEKPDCFRCNDSCISTVNLTNLLGQHIICNTTVEEIVCCDLIQMAPDKCGNNGKIICNNVSNPPFCNCNYNWTGLTCDQIDFQEVMCNCFTLGKAIAYADSMKSCNDAGRPANWTECILDGERENTPMNCICAPLNTTDIRFHLDEKKDLQNCSFSQS